MDLHSYKHHGHCSVQLNDLGLVPGTVLYSMKFILLEVEVSRHKYVRFTTMRLNMARIL